MPLVVSRIDELREHLGESGWTDVPNLNGKLTHDMLKHALNDLNEEGAVWSHIRAELSKVGNIAARATYLKARLLFDDPEAFVLIHFIAPFLFVEPNDQITFWKGQIQTGFFRGATPIMNLYEHDRKPTDPIFVFEGDEQFRLTEAQQAQLYSQSPNLDAIDLTKSEKRAQTVKRDLFGARGDASVTRRSPRIGTSAPNSADSKRGAKKLDGLGAAGLGTVPQFDSEIVSPKPSAAHEAKLKAAENAKAKAHKLLEAQRKETLEAQRKADEATKKQQDMMTQVAELKKQLDNQRLEVCLRTPTVSDTRLISNCRSSVLCDRSCLQFQEQMKRDRHASDESQKSNGSASKKEVCLRTLAPTSARL